MKLLNKKSFLSSSFYILIVTFFLKIMGFAKQVLLAYYFGANANTDIFYLVNSIINAVGLAIFAAVSITIVPIYISLKKNSKVESKFVSNTLLIYILVTTIPILILILYSENIVNLMAPNFSVDQLNIGKKYIKYLAPILYCMGIDNILSSILQAEKKFVLSKSLSFCLNICMFMFAILGYRLGIVSLVYATIAGYTMNCILKIIVTKKYFKFKPENSFKDPYVKKLLVLSLLVFVGNFVFEINSLVDKYLATRLGDGYLSALTFGIVILTLINSLIVGSVSLVFYTYFSESVIEKNKDRMDSYANKAIGIITIILIPISIIMFIASTEIVSILFERGNFSKEMVDITSLVVKGYSLGFLFYGYREIFTKVLYANNDSKNPMKNGIIAVIINISLSIYLSIKIGIIGIAIATSISYLVGSILMYFNLSKYTNVFVVKSIFEIIKLVVCTGITIVVVFYGYNQLKCGNIINLLIVSAGTIIIFISILILFRFRYIISFCKSKMVKYKK